MSRTERLQTDGLGTAGLTVKNWKAERGFTLIELVMVMVLVSIMSVIGVSIILPPFEAAAGMERRARLVDNADLALGRISHEVRGALPNSVQASGNQLTFIPVVTGGRYRRLPGDGSNNLLVPARISGNFDVLTPLEPAGLSGLQISIYNTGQPGFNAWTGDHLATITGASAGNIVYNNARFSTHSPRQRFYIIDQAVSYICSAGQLRRYRHALNATPSGSGELVSADVSDCKFVYNPGSSSRRSLLTASLTLSRGGENISLLVQAQVSNSP